MSDVNLQWAEDARLSAIHNFTDLELLDSKPARGLATHTPVPGYLYKPSKVLSAEAFLMNAKRASNTISNRKPAKAGNQPAPSDKVKSFAYHEATPATNDISSLTKA